VHDDSDGCGVFGGLGDYSVHNVLENENVYSDIILTCIIASFVKQNQAISFCFVP
jgi:hypothetical protein